MEHGSKKSRLSSSRGIALLMVLASLAIMSGLIVEFAYNSNVTYNLAMNEKDRVQAYYLAESALSFSKLILKFDKEARKLAGEASNKLGRTVQIQPLYEMIPLNSEVLRGVAQAQEGTPSEGGEGGEGGEAPSASGSPAQALGGFNVQGAESFLAFEGDFSSEITEEEAKLNVNAFVNLIPGDKNYDRLKSTLYHLLLTDEFKGMFDDKFRGAKDLAQNIADYSDRDDAQNDAGGQDRGREGVGLAAGQVKMKNAKLLSLEELMLVPGMNEGIFQKLKPYLTVYGVDEKIFVCRAKDPLVKALILAYTENNTKLEPLRDENTDLLTKATDAVLNSCPDMQAMANELDKALGVAGSESSPSSGESGTKGPTSTLPGATTRTGAPVGAAADNFSNMIKNENKIFTVIGIGTVGETEVRLKTVLDTTNPNPNRWPMLYWRVE
ncbi:MAG: general secretion pathway protein GspK [Deltaproteobacteria bacterium]|nr:general secretion pathway protein GspK [Deltaproteobacteria bacterium]